MQIGKYNLINFIKTIDLELTKSSIYTIKNRGGKKNGKANRAWRSIWTR